MFRLKKKLIDSLNLNIKFAKEFFVDKERKIMINKVLPIKIKLDQHEFDSIKEGKSLDEPEIWIKKYVVGNITKN